LGIVLFGLITLGVSLLMAVAPAALLIFARGVRPLSKGLWVFLSLLPVAAMFILGHHSLPIAYFSYPSWAVYFVFLWFGRDATAAARSRL
jgi:hypothetical protein